MRYEGVVRFERPAMMDLAEGTWSQSAKWRTMSAFEDSSSMMESSSRLPATVLMFGYLVVMAVAFWASRTRAVISYSGWAETITSMAVPPM